MPLVDFDNRPVQAGMSVKIYRTAAARQIFRGAFLATMKSGHRGAFLATTKSGHRGIWMRKFKGTRVGKYVNKPWTRMDRKYRLPITELFGVRLPSILEHITVMPNVLYLTGDRMEKNLASELNYELSKL